MSLPWLVVQSASFTTNRKAWVNYTSAAGDLLDTKYCLTVELLYTITFHVSLWKDKKVASRAFIATLANNDTLEFKRPQQQKSHFLSFHNRQI